MAATKFTRRAEPSGWLTVKLSSSHRPIALCEYTKVELTRQQGGLTYFKVADGNSEFVGQEAYLHDNNVAVCLSDTGPRGAASVTVRYAGITQHDLTKWNAIYDYLISSREPGSLGKRVGRVVVQK
jgi:hypothetical protein